MTRLNADQVQNSLPRYSVGSVTIPIGVRQVGMGGLRCWANDEHRAQS